MTKAKKTRAKKTRAKKTRAKKTRAKKTRAKKNHAHHDEVLRAWDAACALYRPPIDRPRAERSLRALLALIATFDGAHEDSAGEDGAAEHSADDGKTREERAAIRREAEQLLLVVESGGDAGAQRRALEDWRAFAQRRLRAQERVDHLAMLLRSIGVNDVRAVLPPATAARFCRAWVEERLDEIGGASDRPDRATAARFRDDVVPHDAAEAYRIARHAYRARAWSHAAACAQAAEQHRTPAWRERARVLRITALHRAGARDAALLRATCTAFTAEVKRGRKVWMFDWRSLAALTLLYEIDDVAILTALAEAWRTADPTFAATALLHPPSQRA